MSQLPGFIGFEKLKITCIVGIEPQERLLQQEIYVDLKVQADLLPAVQADDLRYGIDYTALAELCASVAERGFFLIETYAAAVLDQVMERFNVEWAWIAVRKPGCIPHASCALVELSKERRR